MYQMCMYMDWDLLNCFNGLNKSIISMVHENPFSSPLWYNTNYIFKTSQCSLKTIMSHTIITMVYQYVVKHCTLEMFASLTINQYFLTMWRYFTILHLCCLACNIDRCEIFLWILLCSLPYNYLIIVLLHDSSPPTTEIKVFCYQTFKTITLRPKVL